MLATMVAPITEELFKFITLKFTKNSLVPTTTFAYLEAFQYIATIMTNPVMGGIEKLVWFLWRLVVTAPLHIHTAATMKNTRSSQKWKTYKTVDRQVAKHFTHNASFSYVIPVIFKKMQVQVVLALAFVHEFYRTYKYDTNIIKDTKHGLHYLFFGKPEVSARRTSARRTSARRTSARRTSARLTSARLTSARLTSARRTSFHGEKNQNKNRLFTLW